MKVEASAIILSGGKNSRMNYNTKAFLTIGNERFINRIIKNISDFDEIMISCNHPELYEEYCNKCILVKDIVKDAGPIGGIYSTLKKIKNDKALIIAADMPFVTEKVAKSLIEVDFYGDALVPIVNGIEQPLCAVYKKSCIEKIKNEINKGNYKLRNILKNLNVNYILMNDEKSMTNVNTPEEYKSIVQKKKPTLINIVGSSSNVGKTTVIVGLITELKKNDYSVATIKHDVHGFDIDKEGKDTWKHRKAGAETVCISSKNRFAMIKEVDEEININKIIENIGEVDFIIIEGYKKSNFRKIEVAREEKSKNIITPKEKLIAIISDFDPEIEGIEWIQLEDYKRLMKIVIDEKQRQSEVSE